MSELTSVPTPDSWLLYSRSTFVSVKCFTLEWGQHSTLWHHKR